MAKKFKFRLDSLLNLRGYKVSEAKNSLSQAVSLRIEKEMRIEEFTDYNRNLRVNGNGSKKASDFQAYVYHKQFVEKQIDNLRDEREKVIEIESVRRNVLSEAMKEEKVLSRLKEKQIDVHKKQTEKEEIQFLDEVAIKRHDND